MLTFFRKIRRALLGGSHTSKYILYAIGEIALVVIGILIALQVNNWNQDIQRNKEGVEYLQQLKSDWETDTANFQASIQFGIDRINSIDYVLMQLDRSKRELDESAMLRHLNLIVWLDNINVSSATYEDLVGTGNLDLIQPTHFRKRIQDYYQFIEDAKHSIGINNLTVLEYLAPFTFDHFSWNRIFRRPYTDELFPLPQLDRELFILWDLGYESREMRKFENMLTWRHIDVDLEIDRFQTLFNKASQLLQLCEEQLNGER